MLYTTSLKSYNLFNMCMNYSYEYGQAKDCNGMTTPKRFNHHKKFYFYVKDNFYTLSFVKNIIDKAKDLY